MTLGQILAWADAHHARTREWPTLRSGPVAGAPGETWRAVEAALRQGRWGLVGGSSLAILLAARGGIRNPQNLPPLTYEQVLGWADGHHRRTGEWPNRVCGPVRDGLGEV